MVLPYIKQGEDYRTMLESDVNKRIVLTKIKEAFDNEGFTTVDLVAKLKTLSQSNVFQADNQTDMKRMVVEQSGADVYVEAERGRTDNKFRPIKYGGEDGKGRELPLWLEDAIYDVKKKYKTKV